MTQRNHVKQWIGYLIIVIGLAVLASPFVTGYLDGIRQKQVVDAFVQKSNKEDRKVPAKKTEPEAEPKSEAESEAEAESGLETDKEDASLQEDALYQAACAYNQEIFENRQSNLTSLTATQHFPLRTTDYGYEENIIGTLWIPRLEVELGMYLGASDEQMAKGAAIFGQTSLPLGNENENCAIAGHRGWRGTAMFRDIQQMQMGDAIYIQTAWATLVYRVCEIQIVTPMDQSWCQIQPGRSLVTLMTCHPYTQHTQRYIVFGELAERLDPGALDELRRGEALEEAAEAELESKKTVMQYQEDGTAEEIVIDSSAIRPDGSEYGAVWSNVVILAEKQILRLTLVLTVGVILLGIWLLWQTIQDHRLKRLEKKRKEGQK